MLSFLILASLGFDDEIRKILIIDWVEFRQVSINFQCLHPGSYAQISLLSTHKTL